MSLISEHEGSAWPYVGKVTCICCGVKPESGGAYFGFGEIFICSSCAVHGDLEAFAVSLGDAILDFYKQSPTGKPPQQYPGRIVKKIMERLESAIYRAIAVGYFARNRDKPNCGLGKTRSE